MRKRKEELEALFLSSPVSMDGESERGWLLARRLVDPPHA